MSDEDDVSEVCRAAVPCTPVLEGPRTGYDVDQHWNHDVSDVSARSDIDAVSAVKAAGVYILPDMCQIFSPLKMKFNVDFPMLFSTQNCPSFLFLDLSF